MLRLRIAIAQINLLVGDIRGNARRILACAGEARKRLDADLVVFPELTLTGYPPEDLLLRPALYRRLDRALAEIQKGSPDIDLLIGYPHRTKEHTYNACAYIRKGEIIARYYKQELPNYGVFDEKRYFVEGRLPSLLDIKGTPVAITICEDIWVPGPMQKAAHLGARLMLNINASPYHKGKGMEREELLGQRAREGDMPIAYVNLVGGQDELVFDGHSLVVSANGGIAFRAPSFEEGLYAVEFDLGDVVRPLAGSVHRVLSEEESIYRALVTGVRDYVLKNGFNGVVIGLSGGIDSALTLAIAVDALGPARVEVLLMPSRHTAPMSIEDAIAQADSMGVAYSIISIEPMFQAFLNGLKDVLAGTERDTTEENLQARCRGILLMAVSNKKGKIVLTTGNKSETAVGYMTLYGDMAGGFAPLKDVPKMYVYRLARWRNGEKPAIPQRVLERPPSAELAPEQIDEDSLPPYAILDAILERYVEEDQSPEEIVAQGFDAATVNRVGGMVLRNEYKRRQGAPGVRITTRAFGRDRRYPITSGYKT